MSEPRALADAPRGVSAAGLPALIIFDCDGVLVDSEPISLAMLTGALNDIGVGLDVETVRIRFAGTSMASIMEQIGREYPVTVPPGFVDDVKARTLLAFDTQLRALAGVREAIERLDIPFCVASSSDPVRIAHSLRLTGLLPLFGGSLFSSSMVARGKPAPDLFLHAAAQCGADPEECLVIEDSVPGVLAAGAAGMRVIGFTGGGHWHHDRSGSDLARAGAEKVFDDYRLFPGIIGAARSQRRVDEAENV